MGSEQPGEESTEKRYVITPRSRPDSVSGITYKIQTGYGEMYVTVNEDEKGILEVFAHLSGSGGYTASFCEGVGRLASLAMRSGITVEDVVDQLEGIRSPKISYDHGERVLSIPDGIALVLKRHIGIQTQTGVEDAVPE